MRERVGAWVVTVTPGAAEARNTRTGRVETTSVLLFPVGWRVGQVWSGPVPKTVVTLANRLAKRMTRADANASRRRANGGR